jgi:uncharacterized protein YndB with AHSA1/START domain
MEKPKFVYITYIRTTPQKLWEAVTNADHTRQYWGGLSNKSTDWAKGSKWQHINEEKDNEVYVFGEVLESTPFKRLVLSWFDPDDATDSSVVTMELEPYDDMVRLKVIHGEFKDGSPTQGRVSEGWPAVLSSMKSYLETGKGVDIFASMAAAHRAEGK